MAFPGRPDRRPTRRRHDARSVARPERPAPPPHRTARRRHHSDHHRTARRPLRSDGRRDRHGRQPADPGRQPLRLLHRHRRTAGRIRTLHHRVALVRTATPDGAAAVHALAPRIPLRPHVRMGRDRTGRHAAHRGRHATRLAAERSVHLRHRRRDRGLRCATSRRWSIRPSTSRTIANGGCSTRCPRSAISSPNSSPRNVGSCRNSTRSPTSCANHRTEQDHETTPHPRCRYRRHDGRQQTPQAARRRLGGHRHRGHRRAPLPARVSLHPVRDVSSATTW